MIQIMLGIGVNNEDDTATVKVGSVLYFTQRRIESLLLQLNKPLTHTIMPGSKRPARDTPPRKCLRCSNRGLQRDI